MSFRKLPISWVKVGKRTRSDVGDISSLADSIRVVGLLQPIVVDGDHNLIAGQRRIEAWKLARPETGSIPAVVVTNLGDALLRLQAERDENTCRKDMTVSELYELGKRIERLEQPKARERQAHGKTAPGKRLSPDGPERSGSTKEKVAEAIGMSRSQWDRLKRVGDAAASGDEGAQHAMADVDAGRKTMTRVHEEHQGRKTSLPSTVGDVRTLPRKKSAKDVLSRVMDQLDGLRDVLERVDVEGVNVSDAERLAQSMSQFRSVLSRKINQLRGVA